MQSVSFGEESQRKICILLRFGSNYVSRNHPCNGIIRPVCRCFPGQELTADAFDSLHFQHSAVLMFRPLIHRKDAVGIGSCRDDRNRAADRRQLPSQVIRAAEMSGQDGNCKPSALVQHHHRRVTRLTLAMRCDGTDGDSGSSHKNQGVRLCKLLCCPLCKRHIALTAPAHGTGQDCRQPLRQRKALLGKGKIRANHRDSPLRNSVVKVGS